MRLKYFFKILIVFITILLFLQIFPAQEKSMKLKIEPYIFENAKKEKIDAEFGRLKVPENRQKSNGKMIELAFVRFKSTSANPGSPIIYLAGGPGGSGIRSAQGNRFELFMAMREFGDVIALDQRGTGQSKPNLRCFNSSDLPLDKPLTRESILKEETQRIKACAESWEKAGVDVSAYNTVESANDLNDLRKALGAEKVILWGISYGTHLSLATIRQHGKYIDQAILAGLEGTDDTLKLPGNTQKLLIELDRRMKKDKELSKEIPDLLKLMESVLKRLEKKPETVEITHPRTKEKVKVIIGKYDVQLIVGAYSGSDRFLSTIPRLFKSMEQGDFSFVAEQSFGIRKGRTSSVMSIAMDCASGISQNRLARIKKEAKKTLLADAINDPFIEVCREINHEKLGDDFRKLVKTDVPTLFISGTLDGRTPVSNAEDILKGFENRSHLIIDGAGHSDPLFLSTPKIKETILKFMKGEKLPEIIEVETEEPFEFQPLTSEKE